MKRIKNNNKKIFFSLFVGLIVFSFIFQGISTRKNQMAEAAQSASKIQLNTAKQLEFQKQMRKLWDENCVWTRMMIIAITSNVLEINQSTGRLIQNCNDLANTIRPYYGDETANKFNNLMTEHVKLTSKLTTDLKNRSKLAEKTENDWYKNAGDLANILSSANSSFSKIELETMLFNYLKLIKMESSVRLKKDYKTDINVFDMAHDQAISLADLLSEGTVKQSADKFQCL